jgi:hypothetical protein
VCVVGEGRRGFLAQCCWHHIIKTQQCLKSINFIFAYVPPTTDMDEMDTPATRQLNLNAAIQSMVLLKNDPVNGASVLPITSKQTVALIGPHFNSTQDMLSDYSPGRWWAVSPLKAAQVTHTHTHTHTHARTHARTRTLTRTHTHTHTHLHLHTLTHSPTNALAYSLTHSRTLWLGHNNATPPPTQNHTYTHLLTDALAYSLNPSLTHSLLHATPNTEPSRLLTDALAYSLNPSLTHSLLHAASNTEPSRCATRWLRTRLHVGRRRHDWHCCRCCSGCKGRRRNRSRRAHPIERSH